MFTNKLATNKAVSTTTTDLKYYSSTTPDRKTRLQAKSKRGLKRSANRAVRRTAIDQINEH